MESADCISNGACSTTSAAPMITFKPSPLAEQFSHAALFREHRSRILSSSPYTKGLRITAWRHSPPAPFGWGYSTPPPAQHPDPAAVSQEQLCTSRSPRKGHTHLEDSKTLTITSLIRTGVGRGPQIVVVNDKMVAKIYDPMYYNSEECTDVVWCADRAYSREAAAYEHLQKSDAISDVVPGFYGTWTFDVDTAIIRDGALVLCKRPICMILIEHLDGQSMEALDVRKMSESTRTNILKQSLEAEIRIYHAGISHGDLCPRNIMVCGLEPDSQNIRVKLIDFDVSMVFYNPNFGNRAYLELRERFTRKWHPKLTSPVVRFFGKLAAFSCDGWCDGGHRGAEQWLWQNYAHDDRYAPVQWNQADEFNRPTYVDIVEKRDNGGCNKQDLVTIRSGSENAQVA